MRICIALDLFRVDQADHHQAVNRLHRIDGVSARNGNADAAADLCAAFQNLAYGGGGQHIDRHTDQRQRHDGPPAHGIHIADGVGGGDAAEVGRVIDDGHEKIGGGNQGQVVADLVYRSVVGCAYAHQQFGWNRHRGRAFENFAQDSRRDFAAAATAVGERGQAGFGAGVRRCHVQVLRIGREGWR